MTLIGAMQILRHTPKSETPWKAAHLRPILGLRYTEYIGAVQCLTGTMSTLSSFFLSPPLLSKNNRKRGEQKVSNDNALGNLYPILVTLEMFVFIQKATL